MSTVNLGGMQSVSLLTGSIDYSQIITQLNQANRAPGDALNQNIQQNQLKSNDWSQIASLASTLQNSLVAMADNSTFDSFTTTVTNTDGSTGTYLTATASAGATPATYNINVASSGIGTYASTTSGSAIGATPDPNATPISSHVFAQPISTGNVTVTVGTESQQISIASGDTINGILGKINTAFQTNYPNGVIDYTTQPSINPTTGNLTFTNTSGSTISFGTAGDSSNFFQVLGLDKLGAVANGGTATSSTRVGHAQLDTSLQTANLATAINIPSGLTQGTISINGVAITYKSTDTLQTVLNNINASKAGVTAAYDPINDKVTLTSKTSQAVTVSDTDANGNASGNLGLALGLTTNAVVQAGTNWTYSIGGTTYTSTTPTVSNTIPGVSFTIQSAGSTTLTVAADTSKLTANVTAFVNAFNSLYNQLQTNTKKGADLQGDEAMSQLGFKYMSDALSPNLPNISSDFAGQSVMNIGISSGAIGTSVSSSYNLQVDTGQLTTAFLNNPNQVISLLQGMATKLNTDLTSLTGSVNVLNPLNSVSSKFVGLAQSEENMYSDMNKNLETQQQNIYDMADQQEKTLQAQFTALQQFQSQTQMQMDAMKALMG